MKSKLAALMQSPVVAGLAVAAAVVRLFWIVYVLSPPHVQLDFSTFYLGAWAIRHHLNPYHTDLQPYADRLHIVIGPLIRSNYPPTFFLLMKPITRLRPWTAYWVWSGMSVVLLLVSLLLLVPPKKMRLPTALILISIAIMYRPLQIHFEFLQVQIVLLILLIAMWRELSRGDEVGAGAILALMGLIKVYPLFMMLYLLCARKWWALASTLIVLVGGFALTIAVIGPRGWGFFDTVFRHVDPNVGVPQVPTVGIAGALVRLTRHFDPAESIRWLIISRRVTSSILQLAVLSITALAIARSRTDPRKAQYAFGLCVVAMVLCFSNSWAHYMVLFLIPFSQIAVASVSGDAPTIAPMLAAISFVIAEISYSSGYWSFQHGELNLGLWLMEGMFASTVLIYVAAYILTTRDGRSAPRR